MGAADVNDGEPESAASPDCRGATDAIRRFVAGEDVRGERERLRAHVARCESCRAYYREFIETAARLSRAVRPTLASAERDDDEDEAPPRRVSMLSPVQQRKPTRWAKVLLVVIGLAACFALVRPDRAPARVRIELVDGDARVGARQLAPDDGKVDVRRGEACSTGASSHARLRSRESTALLGPATAAIVEDEFALRLHLLEGRLELDGDALVVTPIGAVEIDGARADVRADGRDLRVLAHAGRVRVSDATSTRELPAGQECVVTPP
jgi:hypothetical protein